MTKPAQQAGPPLVVRPIGRLFTEGQTPWAVWNEPGPAGEAFRTQAVQQAMFQVLAQALQQFPRHLYDINAQIFTPPITDKTAEPEVRVSVEIHVYERAMHGAQRRKAH